jgi:hypothetical protein
MKDNLRCNVRLATRVPTLGTVLAPGGPTFIQESAMPDDDRQREYEEIKRDLMRRGRGVAEAEAIAARTVSRPRTNEPPSAAQLASARGASSERSYRELYAEAKSRGISGRSTMSKAELERRLAG